MNEKKVTKIKNQMFDQFDNCWDQGVEPTRMLECFMILTEYFKHGYNPEDRVEVKDGHLLFHVTKNKIKIYNTETKKRQIATLTLK
jgi:hypothetical protein